MAPPTPQPQTTPTKTLRTRMGTLVRRSSSALSFTRPTHSRSSSESLKLDPHHATPSHEVDHQLPSPVPESPAREGAATTDSQPPGHSKLAESPITASGPIDIPPKAPVPQEAWGDGTIASPPGEMSAAHSVHSQAQSTQHPDEHPPTEVLARPWGQSIEPTVHPAPVSNEPESVLVPEAKPDTVEVPEAKQEPVVSPTAQAAVEAPSAPKAPSVVSVSVSHNPWQQSDAGRSNTVEQPVQATAPSHIDLPAPGKAEEGLSTGTTPRPLDHPKDAQDMKRKPSKASIVSQARTRASTVSSQARPVTPPPVIVDGGVSSKPSQVSVSSPGPKSAQAVFVPHQGDDAQPPHMLQSYDDPFADPAPELPPVHIYSPTSTGPGRMPEPMSMPGMLIDDEPSAEVSMPVPVAELVMPTSTTHPGPSMYSLGGRSGALRQPEPVGYETDETLPLLRQPSQGAATDGTRFPEPDTHAQPIAIFNNAFQHDFDSFEKLGWRMHVLPDTSVYFVHPALHVVTDVDLRHPSKMQELTRFLGKAPLPPLEWEAWLRSGGKKQNFDPAQAWVNHSKRIISLDRNPERTETGDISEEAKLEMEHRYWSYVETHPAHILLPPTSVSEAMDMLTWSYTERLLPSTSGTVPAFSHEECQELMGILRSLDANATPGQAVIRTHIVAKVMLRMTACRQRHGSPNAQRNKHAGGGESIFPFGRKVVDLALSAVCLGIPYLFLDRSRHHRIDAESGLRSSAGPMIAVGAVACMIAAVILSASVTFITLPGLDDLARIAGLVAIVLSASSLMSAILALFRYKADIERHSSYAIGGEGLVVITRRSILLSLPLVFLAWAIAAFVAGVALYALRGSSISNVGDVSRHFGEYTRWAVVGAIGGLAGVLVACTLLLL